MDFPPLMHMKCEAHTAAWEQISKITELCSSTSSKLKTHKNTETTRRLSNIPIKIRRPYSQTYCLKTQSQYITAPAAGLLSDFDEFRLQSSNSCTSSSLQRMPVRWSVSEVREPRELRVSLEVKPREHDASFVGM